jgi:hypothetical protein
VGGPSSSRLWWDAESGASLLMRSLASPRPGTPSRFTGPPTASRHFELLCLCLSASPERLGADLAEGVDWVGLAAIANTHLVAPALWLALDRKGLLPVVPGDFRDYLSAIYRANQTRMAAMRHQARAAVASLNAAEIAPILLKGAARLFEETEDVGGGRMMADLDILVEEPRFDAALAALRRLGYEVVDGHDPQSREFHATTLRCSGAPFAIDLHRDIGPQRRFIPLAEAVAGAQPLRAEACELRLLAPTHRIMHLFFHAQVHDRGHLAGIIPLRHLEDFAWIVARHAPAIDWPGIVRACDRLRLRGPWEAWLHLAEICLGTRIAMPAPPTLRARLHYRRCLFQLDHRWAGAALRQAIAVTEPLSYANIDYRYGCGASRSGLFRARAREMLRLFGKYRLRLPQRLAAAFRDAD